MLYIIGFPALSVRLSVLLICLIVGGFLARPLFVRKGVFLWVKTSFLAKTFPVFDPQMSYASVASLQPVYGPRFSGWVNTCPVSLFAPWGLFPSQFPRVKAISCGLAARLRSSGPICITDLLPSELGVTPISRPPVAVATSTIFHHIKIHLQSWQ